MNIKWLASAFLCTGLMYCGGGGSGGSGVDGSAAVGDLSTAEAEDLCDYLASLQNPRTVTCTVDGQTTTIELGIADDELADAIDECVDELSAIPDCTATVDQAESCAEGSSGQLDDLSDDEICAIFSGETPPPEQPASCDALDVASCDVPE